ncbi:B3 domain-containing protein Os03g0212300-like [Miscanthus floridulus]|uniref:B3 domain-containing protein Os03g0212300-like n=1 Tax=Miscanthus floridulus TaxID=154761 RepID=UPI003459B9E0
MAGLSQSDLECMKILLSGLYAETLKLPAAMARVVEGCRKLKLCINVKVFDLTTCRKQHLHDFEASGSQLSLPIVEPRSFVVILKKYHLKAKYLAKNVPVDFERVHDYKQWRMVELQMVGQSWFMGLERTCMNKVLRVSFKYGWGAFCADNLNVSNTYSNDDDEEQEEEVEDNEAKLGVTKLKVEVRKTNGKWRR